MAFTTKVKRNKGFFDNMKKLEKGPYVKVGVLQVEGGDETHEGTELTVAEVATFHEFGGEGDHPPERSVIRATARERRADINKFRAKVFAQVLLGKMTPARALALLGEYIKALMQNRIRSGIPPALADSTLKAKTRAGKVGTIPLIDTGQLLGAYGYQVVEDGGE